MKRLDFIRYFEKIILVSVGIFFSIALILSLSEINWEKNEKNFSNWNFETPFLINDTVIFVDKALSNKEKLTGLSSETKLADNQGLFFVFDEPSLHGIWMKDMKFPIDIFWFDENLKIIHIERGVEPETFPEVFTPPLPSLFILETVAGFADTHEISVGEWGKFTEEAP